MGCVFVVSGDCDFAHATLSQRFRTAEESHLDEKGDTSPDQHLRGNHRIRSARVKDAATCRRRSPYDGHSMQR